MLIVSLFLQVCLLWWFELKISPMTGHWSRYKTDCENQEDKMSDKHEAMKSLLRPSGYQEHPVSVSDVQFD
ncbi:hypothetical protein EYF80_015332 [Liparis tanakae]|uniref:Uncharacterized protein n=1 Tax=Liparis tanakae TaxID=230148 RepID=A0A4Z2IB54_9TELE|nr:hypothetical protein EYF80_015332 [Liparis tanakae]